MVVATALVLVPHYSVFRPRRRCRCLLSRNTKAATNARATVKPNAQNPKPSADRLATATPFAPRMETTATMSA